MVELNLAWTFLRKLVGSETGTSSFGGFGGDDGDGDGDVVDVIESHIELHLGSVFTPKVVQARGPSLLQAHTVIAKQRHAVEIGAIKHQSSRKNNSNRNDKSISRKRPPPPREAAR